MTAEAAPPLVTIADIRAAAERIRGVVVRTPLVPFGPPEARRFLKAESLQPIGAFKLRGAYATISTLSRDELARGVITYSSGNHAQGVARAARLLGAPAVVVMPSDAPAVKRARVEADGAEVVVVGNASDERQRVAEAIAGRRGLTIIPPYDDDRIIAGQGTIGLELVEDLPDISVVLVPIGGGGLASGVAVGRQGAAARPLVSSASNPSWRPMPATPWPVARSSAGRPSTCRGRSPTGRERRRSERRTFAHLREHPRLDRDRDARSRSRPGSASPPSEAGWSSSRPARSASRPSPSMRGSRAWIPGTGPIVAIVSGGNVDPGQYRDYLEAPIPPEG